MSVRILTLLVGPRQDQLRAGQVRRRQRDPRRDHVDFCDGFSAAESRGHDWGWYPPCVSSLAADYLQEKEHLQQCQMLYINLMSVCGRVPVLALLTCAGRPTARPLRRWRRPGSRHVAF